MVKATTCITVDGDLLDELRSRHLKVSTVINKLLRSYIERIKLEEVKPVDTQNKNRAESNQ